MQRQGGSAKPSLGWILLLPLLALAIGLLAGAAPRETKAALDSEEQTLLTLINDYRAQNGLGALALNSQLNDAARWMSQDMAANNYFGHTDSLGRNPFQRMADFGYTYNTWMGESLAAGVASAQEVFALWKGSPEHSVIMLTPDFRAIGIGRAYGPGTTYGWYWVTDFGGQGDPLPPPDPTPPPSPTGLGDVDCDGDADAVDALFILRQVANLEWLGDCMDLGNVDCDEGVDAADALAILRHVADLPPVSAPPGCPPIGSPPPAT